MKLAPLALTALLAVAPAVAGQVLAVSPSIDPVTRSVMARASIAAAPGIVAGRNVSVTIKGSQGSGGVAVSQNRTNKASASFEMVI